MLHAVMARLLHELVRCLETQLWALGDVAETEGIALCGSTAADNWPPRGFSSCWIEIGGYEDFLAELRALRGALRPCCAKRIEGAVSMNIESNDRSSMHDSNRA